MSHKAVSGEGCPAVNADGIPCCHRRAHEGLCEVRTADCPKTAQPCWRSWQAAAERLLVALGAGL